MIWAIDTVALAGDNGLGIVVAVLLALGIELLHAFGVVLREVDKLYRSLSSRSKSLTA